MSPVGIPDKPYVENPDHKPNPLYMTGTVETSGTAGGRLQHSIEAVSPVFANERARKAEGVEVDERETATVPSTGVGDSTVLGQTLDTTGTDGRGGTPEVPLVEGTITDPAVGLEGRAEPEPDEVERVAATNNSTYNATADVIPIIDTTQTGGPRPGEVMKDVVGDAEPTEEEKAETDARAEAVGDEHDAKAEDDAKAAEAEEKFDPSQHTVHDVKAYLETADEKETKRVLAAERKGQARKSLVGE